MKKSQICAINLGMNNYMMCEHCSSTKFHADGSPYWECKKFHTILNENKDKFLVKCDQCLNN